MRNHNNWYRKNCAYEKDKNMTHIRQIYKTRPVAGPDFIYMRKLFLDQRVLDIKY
jgi:hypothetical protein